MALVSLNCDIYTLEKLNSAVTPYLKNSTMSLGRFARDSTYCSEILCNPLNISTIPAGSVISDVSIKYNVVANSIATTTQGYINIYKEDKGAWTDTGSAPIYSTFAATSWATLELTDVYQFTPSSPTGNYTMATNSTFATLLSGWVNGTVNKDGFIMSLNFGYYNSYIDINTVTLDVTYTPTSSLNNFFYYYKRRRTV